MGEKTMTGKTLFISGGTRGIGKAMVYAFAAKGCDVAFTYASSADTANEIIADVEGCQLNVIIDGSCAFRLKLNQFLEVELVNHSTGEKIYDVNLEKIYTDMLNK